VREAFRRAASEGPLVGRLEHADDGLVSSDIVGDAASCDFDAELTMAADRGVKVLAWYDNERGYANRLAELTAKVGAASRVERG
jgi:glyceraldehyde 3-phosphate dehydrogenase